MSLLKDGSSFVLDEFAKKYGIHGYMIYLDLDDDEKFKKILEVKSLDFSLKGYAPSEGATAIPKDEKVKYLRSVVNHLPLRIFSNGGIYHCAVGKKWLGPEDEDYERVVALLHVGRP